MTFVFPQVEMEPVILREYLLKITPNLRQIPTFLPLKFSEKNAQTKVEQTEEVVPVGSEFAVFVSFSDLM